MQRIDLKLETVTPLLLSGALKEIAELRPGSIEKVVRWWWRWARGESILELENNEEADIFGSTDGSSRFLVRVANLGPNFSQSEKSLSGFLDGADPQPIADSLSYVLFPFRKASMARGQIEVSSEFKLSLCFLPGLSDVQIQQVIGAFWLGLFLGGVGARSRRGLGSFRVLEVSKRLNSDSGADRLTFNADSDSVEPLLRTNLNRILGLFRKDAKTAELPSFTSYSTASHIYLLEQTATSWKEALHNGVSLLISFRCYKDETGLKAIYENDYRSVRSLIDHSAADDKDLPLTYSKAKFGLPIDVNFDDLKMVRMVRIKGRQGSPVFIKVIKITNAAYRTLVSIFPSITVGQRVAQRFRFEQQKNGNPKAKPYGEPLPVDIDQGDILGLFADHVASTGAKELLRFPDNGEVDDQTR